MNDLPSKPPKLVLYKYDACPFCWYVKSALADLQLTIETRDTRSDPEARRELIETGGKSQVPCLFIDGEPLYESRDIVRYLQNYASHYSSSER
jgi:glutaredoxin